MLVFREVRLLIPTAARRGLHLSLTILVWGMLWFVFFRIEVDHSFTQVAASVSLIYTAEDSACITPLYLFSALPADTVLKGDLLKKGLILYICHFKNVFKT